MNSNDVKVGKGEEWRFMGDNDLKLEIIGPHSNQYRIFVQDIDGDWIALLPAEAKRLMAMLQKAVDMIAARRRARRKNHEHRLHQKAG